MRLYRAWLAPRKVTCIVALAAAVVPFFARSATERLDQMESVGRGTFRELTWHDADDSLSVTLTPGSGTVAQPLLIAARLEPASGPPYSGPIALAVRDPSGRTELRTLVKKGGDWRTTFTPSEPGSYALSFTFQTTHHKVVYGSFDVNPPGPPRYLAYVMFGLVGAIVIAVIITGARQLLRPR